MDLGGLVVDSWTNGAVEARDRRRGLAQQASLGFVGWVVREHEPLPHLVLRRALSRTLLDLRDLLDHRRELGRVAARVGTHARAVFGHSTF